MLDVFCDRVIGPSWLVEKFELFEVAFGISGVVQRELRGKVLGSLGVGSLALLVKSKKKSWGTSFSLLLSSRTSSGACNKSSTGCSGEKFAEEDISCYRLAGGGDEWVRSLLYKLSSSSIQATLEYRWVCLQNQPYDRCGDLRIQSVCNALLDLANVGSLYEVFLLEINQFAQFVKGSQVLVCAQYQPHMV